ncbi:MAG: LuxR C-terminal-related transcriptional regulator [Chloroflexia bacterium]
MVTLSKKQSKKTGSPPETGDELVARLTRRQQEVLSLMTGGRSNKEIAHALDLTPSTVKAHVSRLLHALGVKSRVEAAVLWAEIIATADKHNNN